MIIFNNNDELIRLIKKSNGMKYIDFEFQHIKCEFNIALPGVNIINAWNIDARDIKALDIKALDIKANNINARDISYYAVCCAYQNIKCASIKGIRDNSKHFCLDGEIITQNKS